MLEKKDLFFEDIKRLDMLILEKLEQKRKNIKNNGTEKAADIIKKIANLQSNA